MIVGKIVGKTTTVKFEFEISKEVFKYEYVQVYHEKYGYVLAQIYEIEVYDKRSIAKCIVLGYLDNGILKSIKSPLMPNSEVLKASEKEVSNFLKLNENGLYVGLLRDSSIPIYLDLEKVISKHLAIIAKTGAGKSYTVGVILEELIEKGIPVLIIDVHGEYETLAFENDEENDLKNMSKFNIKPQSYAGKIVQYGNINFTSSIPLVLKDNFNVQQLLRIFNDLNSTQQGILFEAISNAEEISLQELYFSLNQLESNKKWSLIAIIDEIKKLGIFSKNNISYNELIQLNRASIINLKGFDPRIQEIIVYKLLYDLFELRKINAIPPFFLVLEEAHNFCPERNFGEKISSEIIRTIASEGRKFGTGICVVSQRPSRIDKNVLSQCNTQIIMKVTNPNDLKSIVQSVEGIYENVEDELKNLQIGQALITGILDVPLIVEIRPRKSKHGGKAKILVNEEAQITNKIEEFKKKEIIPIILPKISENDVLLMNKDAKKVIKNLIPIVLFDCSEGNKKYRLMFELLDGKLVYDYNFFKTKMLPDLSDLSMKEIKVLEAAFLLNEFTLDELSKKVKILDLTLVIKSLIKKNFILEKNSKYVLNDEFVFSELSHFDILENFEYLEISYDKKFDKKINLDKLKSELSKYTTIIAQQEGYLLNYSIG
ncbi:MAG: ATP-binding protein [Candidatus Woesearchaeota archaeon]